MSAQVPMMITAKMRADLLAKGFTEDQIKNMTPPEAWQHLGGMPAAIEPTTNLTGIAALKWLADRGANFCKVAAWNDPGVSPGKKALGTGWQEHPYTFESIQPHIKAGGNVGLLCGKHSGNLGLLDIDAEYSKFKLSFPTLANAPAIVRGGPDKGKIIIRINGDIPGGKKWKHPGDKHPYFEWLSNGNQGVIPPSRHPEGSFYELANTDQAIPEITPDLLDDFCAIWTGEGLLGNEPPAPGEYPQPETESETPPSNGGGLKEAVKGYWDSLKVFQHFDRAKDTRLEKNTELRLKGNGGLFIQQSTGLWAIPGDGKKAGGDCIDAWWYCKTGNHNTPKGKEFYNLLVEMAKAAGIEIPHPTHQVPTPSDPQRKSSPQQPIDLTPAKVPDLPVSARMESTIGAAACPWLDDYIAFSRRWSPRAFDGFHEAVGLWVLSTVAARRVVAHMGKERHSNLYIALTARTSLFAKSSTAEIGIQTINKVGLSWLLAADSATPQKFIADLTPKLAENFDDLTHEQQDFIIRRVGMAGQRGWYYDEFGQHVAAMMREGGFMADFRGLLRRFDDTPERYEYGTIGRGSDVVERPYLALLANLTPDDLRQFARRGSALWGDGFLARFALITPPEGERRRERFPIGERSIPGELLTPLVDWHNRLGVPKVELVDLLDKDGKTTGFKRAEIGPLVLTPLDVPLDVTEAFYTYHDGLLDLVSQSDNHDLDGNYARLAEKALRVSILLASISGAKLGLEHWARAQEITERWRVGLHELYNQINEPALSEEKEHEETLLSIIQKLGGQATAAEAARYVRNFSSGEAARILDSLVDVGELSINTTSKGTRRYILAKNESQS